MLHINRCTGNPEHASVTAILANIRHAGMMEKQFLSH